MSTLSNTLEKTEESSANSSKSMKKPNDESDKSMGFIHFKNKNQSSEVNIDDITELPSKSEECVVSYLKQRIEKNEFYTWAGQTLIAVNPFQNIVNLSETNTYMPSIAQMVSKAWFKLNHNIGKSNQVIVLSGESGSGKTYSASLALKSIASLNESVQEDDNMRILWKAWASIPLLTAFGNAATEHNQNSSRFGKLLQLQYRNDRFEGAYIQTYLLEKCRVSGPNNGESNFHIFHQVLKTMDEKSLNNLYLSKNFTYKIAPKTKTCASLTYQETLDSLEVLEIKDLSEILSVISIILNLGNVKFQLQSDAYFVKNETKKFIENAAKLLYTDDEKLLKLLTTRTINATNQGKRRETIYMSPCLAREECEERLNCLMRLLYENLFLWIVERINSLIYKTDDYVFIGLLDVYGFEAFQYNTFEQLCINYANERLQQYFVKDYLIEEANDLLAEGFNLDSIDSTDYAARVSLLDGAISVFSILNEECMMKRFNTDKFINARITDTLKKHTHFIAANHDFGTEFSIKHYAGVVKYNTRCMVAKNRDKVPQDMIDFLTTDCKFTFVQKILDTEKYLKENSSKTLLKQFKSSLDSLVSILDSANVYYIKCVKPNALQVPSAVDEEYFTNQLRSNGILEVLKLSFQNYSIKLFLADFVKIYSTELLRDLKTELQINFHIGTTLIYLTEGSYYVLEYLYNLKCKLAAIKIQECYRKYISRSKTAVRNEAEVINISKKSSSVDISLTDKKSSVDKLQRISSRTKVEDYVIKHNALVIYEGDPISLHLEKALNELETMHFRRTIFFGDRIISFHKLAKIPIRFHLAKSCIAFSHVLPKSEQPKGLADALS